MSTHLEKISPASTPTRLSKIASTPTRLSKTVSTPTRLSKMASTPNTTTDLTVRNLTVEHLTILKLSPSTRGRTGSSGDEADEMDFLTPSKKKKRKEGKKSEPYKIECEADEMDFLTPSKKKRKEGKKSEPYKIECEADEMDFLTPSKKKRKEGKKSEPYKIEWTEAIGTEEVKEHVELAVLVANSNGLTGNDRADSVIKYLDTKLGGDWSCICTSVGRNQTPSGFIKHKHFFYSFYHDHLEWSVWTSEPIRKYQKKSSCIIV